MKRLVMIVFGLMMLCVAAKADVFDPEAYARITLTERFGYTEEEASRFVFENKQEGLLQYHDADHADRVYQLTYTVNGPICAVSPYETDFSSYPGEYAVRDTLRQAEKENWFSQWNAEHRDALLAWMDSDHHSMMVRRAFENILYSELTDTAQVIQGFFLNCYGDESEWSPALYAWRDEVLAAYGISPDALTRYPEEGITRYSIVKGFYIGKTEVCEFKGVVPDELTPVFSQESRLEGWACLCGTVLRLDAPLAGRPDAYGMAAFEKDGERMLVIMDHDHDQWYLTFPGKRSLYQGDERELSIRAHELSGTYFVLSYKGTEGTESFYLSVVAETDDLLGHYALCRVERCRLISAEGKGTSWIIPDEPYGKWTYITQKDDHVSKETITVDHPCWLGLRDMTDFPVTLEKGRALPSPLPDDCRMTTAVHLRRDHNSHSEDMGTLLDGTVIRVKSRVAGDPYDWFQTDIGLLKGYVNTLYTDVSFGYANLSTIRPLPVAQCEKTIQLRSSAGWISTAVGDFPAGTRMHVIMRRGDWLYVVVPRGEIDWLMDVDGTYGWIRRGDVRVAAMPAYLNMEP